MATTRKVSHRSPNYLGTLELQLTRHVPIEVGAGEHRSVGAIVDHQLELAYNEPGLRVESLTFHFPPEE
jgi:hypothetical protein